jgi:hypothetical protein
MINTATATNYPDSDELMRRLRATAARLIDEHTNALGRCASCAGAWPCDIACRAEFTLGGL